MEKLRHHFIKHLRKCDPDILTGWYVTGADIKQIIERCRVSGLQESLLSPMRQLRYSFGDWDQPIVGRNCIDLMLAVSKLWELKNGKLPSYKLDDVASNFIRGKIEKFDKKYSTHVVLRLDLVITL